MGESANEEIPFIATVFYDDGQLLIPRTVHSTTLSVRSYFSKTPPFLFMNGVTLFL